MKKINKLIALLLTILILCMGSQLIAFASVKTATAEVKLLQEGDYDITPCELDYSAFAMFGLNAETEKSAREYIYQELLNCSAKINVYKYQISTSEFTKFYSDIINSNGDLFFVSSSVSYSYTTQNIIYEITPHYTMEKSEIENAKVIFNNGVQKALSVVDSSMSDEQKALVLHDYICDLATYPKLNSAADDKDIYHSAYGFFYDGNVVCAGYALAYSYLLNQLGIDCEYVTSDPMRHAWNMVKINNKWYNVDTTWDDLGAYNSQNTRGAMLHDCFLKSETAFSGDIGRYHYGGTTHDNCVANDTSYDNYFWNTLTTNICVVNGDYYYFELNSDSSSFGYLKKRTKAGAVSNVSADKINCIKMNISGISTDANGVQHQKTKVDPLVRTVYLDGRFYLTTQNNIISVDLTGKRHNILSNDSYCYGLGITDNELVYQKYSDYSSEQLSKKQYFKSYMSDSTVSKYHNYPDINNDGYVNAKDYAMILNANKS